MPSCVAPVLAVGGVVTDLSMTSGGLDLMFLCGYSSSVPDVFWGAQDKKKLYSEFAELFFPLHYVSGLNNKL